MFLKANLPTSKFLEKRQFIKYATEQIFFYLVRRVCSDNLSVLSSIERQSFDASYLKTALHPDGTL